MCHILRCGAAISEMFYIAAALLLATAVAADRSALAPGKPTLTLEAADLMTSRVIDECKAKAFKDVSVCVVDASGRMLVSKRMLDCASLPQKMAQAKAMACITTNAASSRGLRDKYVGSREPQLLNMVALSTASSEAIAAVPGGMLLKAESDGVVVGAIGVSGATADEDEHLAIVAAQALGLQTDPLKSALQ